MLQDAIRRTIAIADQAGIRALLTHPFDKGAEAFYRCFCFELTPAHERQLILLLTQGCAAFYGNTEMKSNGRRHGGSRRDDVDLNLVLSFDLDDAVMR